MMPTPSTQSRILIVTPEAAFVPAAMINRRHCQRQRQDGYVAFLSSLVNDLCEQGVDVHVAQPDYRLIFAALAGKKCNLADSKLPGHRLHLAEDRVFFYSNLIENNGDWENTKIALNFQREVSYQILPRVQPDLIYCHDWMTGLIPAVAKQHGIPCLFSANSFQSCGCLLAGIEDRGIDAAAIWQDLYYERYPGTYEETRHSNPLDFLLSAVLSASHVTMVNARHLLKMTERQPHGFHGRLMQLLLLKRQTGGASEMPLPHPGLFPDNENQRERDPSGHRAAMIQNRHLPPTGRRNRPDLPVDDRQAAAQYIFELCEMILKRPLVAPVPARAGEGRKGERSKTTSGLKRPERTVRRVNSHAPFGRSQTSPVPAS